MLSKYFRQIIFVQERVGRAGKIVKIPKIRTLKNRLGQNRNHSLYLAGGWDRSYKKNLTKISLLLRRLSLDELPQIFYNILWKKNMQWVGIRPLVPEEFALLPYDIQKNYKKYKPGWIAADIAYDEWQRGNLESRFRAMRRYYRELEKTLSGLGFKLFIFKSKIALRTNLKKIKSLLIVRDFFNKGHSLRLYEAGV